jgi:hypothetical protein
VVGSPCSLHCMIRGGGPGCVAFLSPRVGNQMIREVGSTISSFSLSLLLSPTAFEMEKAKDWKQSTTTSNSKKVQQTSLSHFAPEGECTYNWGHFEHSGCCYCSTLYAQHSLYEHEEHDSWACCVLNPCESLMNYWSRNPHKDIVHIRCIHFILYVHLD